nr:redoxin domain-containing protein [Halobaculum salinum]
MERTYGGGDAGATPEFRPVTFPPSDHPVAGERAPEFTRPLVTREGWEDVPLSALASEAGSVLLVFSPLNWGGKSMYWWKEIERRGWGDDDVAVVGLGVSQPFDHQRFLERRDMPYPLYSDPANGVAEAYDVVHDLDGMAGVAEPRPAAFLLDDGLTVSYEWVADEWPETPPYDDVESAMASP